ncbi:MAG: Heat shock protein 70 [Ilumatobacteraceae bacterium]|nr:Heat shock protein 70 [Ilumatobacteraceae bacterium]
MASWILAIDFGTSYTVAASKVGDRAPEVIEVGGERRMPSVVMVDPSGTIIVGRTADDLSGTHPESTLRALKNRLGDQSPVVLDGRPYQVVNLVAALLKQVYTESVRQMGEPPAEVRLTHPATWNRPRLNRLLEAAAKAELPRPALLPEPVAAALSFASEVGVAQGAFVVVYDLGGGTFDTAVVTASGGGFNIVGRPSGDQNIGGELFDEIIVNHLGGQLPPAAWDAIQIGEEPLWQQVGATLRNEARRAKETLSGNPYADLLIPLPTGLQQLRLTRDEFEELVNPYLAETVVLLDRCVAEAGLDSSQLSGISLVGGSSRSPIVERLVKQAFPTVPVIRRGDPKTAVASGAARAVRSAVTSAPPNVGINTQEAAAGTAQQPVRLAPPTSDGPVAPGSSRPPVSSPPSGVPLAGAAASLPPAAASLPPVVPVAGPASAPPMPVAGGSQSYPPTTASPVGPVPGAPFAPGLVAPPVPAKRSKRPLIIGVVVVALLVIVGVVVIATRGGSTKSTAQPTRASLKSALLTIRQVRDAFSSDWNSEDISGDGDPFCPQFTLANPLRQGETLFSTSDGTGSSFTNTAFFENVSTFASAADATKFYEQDKAITQNCAKANGNLGGLDVVYTITDATRDARPVGRADVNAIKYEASAVGSTDVLLTGYIVETQAGSLIFTTQFTAYNRVPDSKELSSYYDLTKAAFDKAEAAL